MQIDPTLPIMLSGYGAHMPTMVTGSGRSQSTESGPTGAPIPDPAATEKALNELRKAIEPFDISLKFSRDEETGTIVVQMINAAGEMLKQIPNEASLRVAATLSKFQGKIFNFEA